jgi:hypothetical protein
MGCDRNNLSSLCARLELFVQLKDRLSTMVMLLFESLNIPDHQELDFQAYHHLQMKLDHCVSHLID